MKIANWLRKHQALVLIVSLGILLRIPSLYEPAWYGDENIYLAIGQGVRKGLVLYRDITDFPNKPPLIYLMAAGVRSVFWFRFVLLVWNSLHAGLIFYLAKELFGQARWVKQLAALVFVLSTSLPFWEGNIANGEVFMIMPSTAGMLLLWRAKLGRQNQKSSGIKKLQVLIAGMLFSLGFLFKIPVATDIAAAVIFFFFINQFISQKISLKRCLRIFKRLSLYVFGLGLVLPIVAVLVFHASQGVLPLELLRSALGSTGYVRVWQPQVGILAQLSLASLESRSVLLLGLVVGLIMVAKKVSKQLVFLGLWFTLALFGALLSARPYPHYLLQVVAAGSLLVASLLALKPKRENLLVYGVIGLIGVGGYLRFGFYTYPVADYYANFISFVTGYKSEEEFYNEFDQRMARNYRVARYLRTHTAAEDRVYIWGTEPGIYVLSNRLPVGRLTTSFHVEDLNEYARLARQLKNSPPKYIVVMETEKRDFEELEEILDDDYILVKRIEEALIYYYLPLV